MGWLHTCYSPVRRSPPKYCYLALPLDLHVLSLPLAFILSQDQTLRCIIYSSGNASRRNPCSNENIPGPCSISLNKFPRRDSRPARYATPIFQRTSYAFPFDPPLQKNLQIGRPFFWGEKGAKDTTSFLPFQQKTRCFFRLLPIASCAFPIP